MHVITHRVLWMCLKAEETHQACKEILPVARHGAWSELGRLIEGRCQQGANLDDAGNVGKGIVC